MNIEVCCNSVYSVQIAEQLGASRVELCQNLLQDGLTPRLELLQEVCESHA
jgi:copper homeostasis protein CutC